MRRRSTMPVLLVIAMLGVGALSYALTAPPAGPRSIKQFDAGRMKSLELRMWEAYYAKDRVRLFGLLVTMLHEQYHYSWAVATVEGFHLARAASRFSNLQSNYDSVLPDLETAYAEAQSWLRADFDPSAVARAELAWWVARRTPGSDSATHVGDLMADEYAILYDAPLDRVAESAQLRAEAAALRDAEAASPDWNTIGRLLQQSYEALRRALSTASAERNTLDERYPNHDQRGRVRLAPGRP